MSDEHILAVNVGIQGPTLAAIEEATRAVMEEESEVARRQSWKRWYCQRWRRPGDILRGGNETGCRGGNGSNDMEEPAESESESASENVEIHCDRVLTECTTADGGQRLERASFSS
jgi:hypothetical protein